VSIRLYCLDDSEIQNACGWFKDLTLLSVVGAGLEEAKSAPHWGHVSNARFKLSFTELVKIGDYPSHINPYSATNIKAERLKESQQSGFLTFLCVTALS
jgi:hypothetical protein